MRFSGTLRRVTDPEKAAPSLSTQIFTERLVLRAPRAVDVPEMRLVLRRNAAHLHPYSPLPKPGEDPTSITGISSLIARQRSEWRSDRGYAFVVALRQPEKNQSSGASL